MKKILLILAFITPICHGNQQWVNVIYKQCKTIIKTSMLGDTAKQIIFHFLITIENKEDAIAIAEKLYNKNLIDKTMFENIKIRNV